MSGLGVSVPLKALVRAAWRAEFNDGWRFSRAKVGLWRLLVQAALAGLAMWRVSSRPPALPPGNVLLLGFVVGWLMALLMTLLRGRERLFTGSLVNLVHRSPAPAQAVVLLHAISSLPGLAWFALLLCTALFSALDAAGLSAGRMAILLAALWLATLAGGALGHLTGTGALLGLVRRWPGALVLLPAIAMVLLLAQVGLVFFLFTVGLWHLGTPPGPGAPAAPGPHLGAEPALAAVLALPGLLVLAGILRPGGIRPDGRGREAYREAWLAVREALDRHSRPLRSRWPALAGGPVGAVQALAWLLALRNWFSLVRLGLWVALLVLPFFLRSALSGMSPSRLSVLCIGMGLLAALFNYGEQAAALFSAEGERAALPVLAGVRPGELLLGKWLAALPLVLVAAVTTLAWAALAGRSGPEALGLAGISGAIALAAVTWLVGAAAFDAAPRTGGFLAEGEALAAAFEQVPTRPGGIVGLAGGALLAGAGIWLCLTDPRWLPLLAVPALAAALAGWRWVNRVWRRGALG